MVMGFSVYDRVEVDRVKESSLECNDASENVPCLDKLVFDVRISRWA